VRVDLLDHSWSVAKARRHDFDRHSRFESGRGKAAAKPMRGDARQPCFDREPSDDPAQRSGEGVAKEFTIPNYFFGGPTTAGERDWDDAFKRFTALLEAHGTAEQAMAFVKPAVAVLNTFDQRQGRSDLRRDCPRFAP
jgi:hypothetical protein